MSNVNATDLHYWQYFNYNSSYILDYIMKFEDKFIFTKKYNDSGHITSGYIAEPDDLYRIYVSSENDLKDILRGFSTLYDVDKFGKFSDLIRDLIDKLTRKRYPDRDPYEDDSYFVSDGNIIDDDLNYFITNSFARAHCKYIKPNSIEARMVIQWLILFKVCYNNSIELEDIDDFYFAYDAVKKDLHLFIWMKNQSNPRHFIFETTCEISIIDISYWNEEDGLSKMKTFDLSLSTIVSEINKFKLDYTSIIVKGKNKTTDFEDVFRDIFKVMVNNESELRDNLKHLDIDVDDSEFTTSTAFEKFAEDLKNIINDVIINDRVSETEWFFVSNNDFIEDYVSRHLTNTSIKYYTPRLLESRLVVAWVVVYKLCKKYELDRTKIENLTFYYYPRKDFLRIVITIDGEEYKFGLGNARNTNVLDIFWWHNCTTCSTSGCVYINKDEEDDTDTTDTAKDDDKSINQDGFGAIDSLALIKPTEQKSDKRKKLLKMMLIYQMMNNSKK